MWEAMRECCAQGGRELAQRRRAIATPPENIENKIQQNENTLNVFSFFGIQKATHFREKNEYGYQTRMKENFLYLIQKIGKK